MILIVGGAGYIGSHVNKLFSLRGYRTVVFDNLVYGHREFVKWGEFFFGDLAGKEQIRRCFREYAIDAVMHFSAFAYVGESVVDPAKYYLNNVANTLNLLEVMREFQVRHFIFSSTCATYGIPGTIPIPEDHPQKPVNPYGRSKLMIEEILKDYDSAYGIKHINLRYFNAAGADPDAEIGEQHDPETHLIPLTIEAALGRREDIRIFGTDYPTKDGTCIRDYIHVMDLADVHMKALEYVKNRETSDSFNLGNGTGHSVREVIDTVRRISSRDFRVIETERRAGDPPVLIGSSQKAITTLGWRPQFADIGMIVETAWRWHSIQHG
ncbi:MAG: UDP-glucose 4-epimerase GalE [Thermodesulfovibrionales bacterium]|nr:UDP-glucose 4-epimerase GalE [Thermodesulfovibrionales bacterium]